MLHLLMHYPELCVCDIESILEVSQSKASRHLNHLKHAGVVEDRRDGTWIYYCMARSAPAALRSAVREIQKLLADDDQARQDLARAENGRAERACRRPKATKGLES